MIILNCQQCKRLFSTRNRKDRKIKFCSRKCYGDSLKGKSAKWLLSDKKEEIGKKISLAKIGVPNWKASIKLKGRKLLLETRRKISEFNRVNPNRYWLGKKRPELGELLRQKYIGRVLPEKWRKKISQSLYGIKRTDETRKKMSERQKGVKSMWWKGGIAKENKIIRASLQFKLWREKIFERDNWICQGCKKRGGELHPHHIKSFADYPELRFAIDNGRALCKECHKKTDTWGRTSYSVRI